MNPTARTRREAAVAAVLAAIAVLAERPLLVLAAVGLGGLILARQYAAVRAFLRVDDALTVTVRPADGEAVVDEPVPVTVRASLESPVACRVRVSVPPPVGARAAGASGDGSVLTLSPGETEATGVVEWTMPVAGRVDVPDVVVDVDGPTGAFRETLGRASDAEFVVAAPHPQSVHVGRGGERVAGAYGEHTDGASGSGLIPREIRPYVAGDELARIDWNATARLGDPHVREFESQTDRPTALVVDRRRTMGEGPSGEEPLAYVREVALGYAAAAQDRGDPVGLYAVGDDAVTDALAPGATPERYRRVRDALYRIEPDDGVDLRGVMSASRGASGDASDGATAGGPTAPTASSTPAGSSPATTAPSSTATATATTGDGSAFDRALSPFLAGGTRGRRRVDGDPLVAAVERARAETSEGRWIVIATDDADRDRVGEAVGRARAAAAGVVVLLTPRALFEPGSLADVEATYDRYLSFEEFRRGLDNLDGVRALEVAPGDRLDAVLGAAGRRR
ncbi:DUF58 domain-containing protein [Halobaculum sp. CBA1158]|uniref:DUF58 domain-containing protein n=1 Tax=Halobaculum sp. CBA1158 TaxID=2904243 RepID=UPI001F2BDB75|nr:DUF58 domain-containing protein [Halobaculum sp. CBA1158]UIO99742.1 DUF58 domain-containing protein [Halobaculum sp. CBA1158]